MKSMKTQDFEEKINQNLARNDIEIEDKENSSIAANQSNFAQPNDQPQVISKKSSSKYK